MNPASIDFLASAMCKGYSTADFLRWFDARRRATRAVVERVPLRAMRGWSFESSSGNLEHETGRFFKVEGVWVETNFGFKPQWSQPILNQPEIGILGILARRIDGVLHFLMQAKVEPGNVGMFQLAPTLQATRSNFTRAHKGGQPPYLEYFIEQERHRPLVDVLQSEQGARFLRKRNRNVIVEVREEIPILEGFTWLTLGQIHRLLRLDNVVNMCTRTVLSCIGFGDDVERLDGASAAVDAAQATVPSAELLPPRAGSFQARLLDSELATGGGRHSNAEILSWFTGLKFRYELSVERIPLKYVRDWVRGEDSISHVEEKYFSVIGVCFEAESREVAKWAQPLVMQRQQGLVAFIVKEIRGILHFLVQGKVEVGTFDVMEMAPTIQCVTGSYRDASKNECPMFLDVVLNAEPDRVRYHGIQSEEGGRFFQEQNLNLVVEVNGDFPEEVPPNFLWMTLGQLKRFNQYNNFVNAQARCLLSCLGMADDTQMAEAPEQSELQASASLERPADLANISNDRLITP